MKHKIIYVKWIDSVKQLNDTHLDEFAEPAIMESIGWFVKQEKNYISIAQEFDDSKYPQYRFIMHIPKIAILEQREFWLPKTKKKK